MPDEEADVRRAEAEQIPTSLLPQVGRSVDRLHTASETADSQTEIQMMGSRMCSLNRTRHRSIADGFVYTRMFPTLNV